MTRVYFVRHAQPEHAWKEDRTRPLTEEGKKDSAIVLEFLKEKKIDVFYCSPYKRSIDTIAETAAFFGKEIIRDERFREREKDPDKEIVIGTHGTALSTILNFYDNSFGCEDFLRIIDWMPYIIELDFEGNKLVGKYEHCHVEKEFKGSQRADKK